ncbi:MAG: S-layer homology domain-containing protein [Clostridiales bacterium]|nr:S-layer homology domain-containing protein [Clostridiales bacterium]
MAADGYSETGKFLAPIEAPDPAAIEIYDADGLDNMRKNLSGSYVLMNDIDLSGFNGGQWVPIGDNIASGNRSRFTGTFDGQGHVIENLTIIADGLYECAGLFGATSGAIIKNLGLEGSNISISYALSEAGGICGISSNSYIFNCYNTGNISSTSSIYPSFAGGICGGSAAFISNCYNTGNILSNSSYYSSYAGGICGDNTASVSNCYNTGNISSSSFSNASFSFAGGISGYSLGLISNCYSTGNISSSSSSPSASSSTLACAGGICSASYASISNCVVLSNQIYAENISYPSRIRSYLISYGDDKTDNLARKGVGGNAIDDSDERIELADAKKQLIYEALGWDFDDIWYMVVDHDYPQLRNMPKPTDGYTVGFEAGNHGKMDPSSASEKVAEGKTVKNVPEIAPGTGYTHIGWKSNFGGTYDDDAVRLYPITRDITFTAVYATTANATVIFDYNGGKAKEIALDEGIEPEKETEPGREVDSDYVSGSPGALYSVPSPAKTGFVHRGWLLAIKPDGWLSEWPSGIYGAAGTVSKYVAQWAPNVNTVTFNAGENGTIVSGEPSKRINYSESVNSVPEIKADSGYVFIGWESGPGAIYSSEAVKLYPVVRDITFTAKYEDAANATVIFDYNGGAAEGETSSYISGKPGTAFTTPEPLRTGYTFSGWSPEMAGEPALGEAKSVIIYLAQWTANSYPVTFMPGTNGTMTPEEYNKPVSHNESVVSVPSITAESGFNFLGWSLNGGTTYYSDEDILEMPITAKADFVAQYQKIVTGGGGGGERPISATLNVKGVNKAADEVIYNQPTTVLVGETEIIPAPIIKGYVLAEESPTSQSITIKSGNNTVTFYYKYIGESMEESSGERLGLDDSGRIGQQNRLPAGAKIKETLETEIHIRYVNGYPDGSFRPGGNITRAEVALIFWRLLKDPAKNDDFTGSFNDIKDDEFYARAVNYLAKIGILQGYRDGSFKPTAAISRVEFVAVAGRFDDLASGIDNPFKDVPADYWAYGYVVSAYQKGWIDGYPGGEFRPQNSISRAEAVKIVNCMLGRGIQVADLPGGLPSFTDLTSSHWAYCEIMEASIEHKFERKEDNWEIWK